MSMTMRKRCVRKERTESAEQEFEKAVEVANQLNIRLVKCTDFHYQMRYQDWIYDMWPPAGQIRRDPKHKGPYIHCPGPDFSLVNAIMALGEKTIGH